ncbi:hypothetical protein KKG46_01985 [Patescibacteria group bacterium]|nr:hypothetical protein [Patescibacteria group bacterium]
MPEAQDTNQTPQDSQNPLQDVLASRYSSAYRSFLESIKIHPDNPNEIAKNIAKLDPETYKKVTKQLAKTKKGAQSFLLGATPISIPTETLNNLRTSVFNKSLERDFKYNQSRIQEQLDSAKTSLLSGVTGADASKQVAQNLREIFGIKEKKPKTVNKKQTSKKDNKPEPQNEAVNESPAPEQPTTLTTPSLANEEPAQTLKTAEPLPQTTKGKTVRIPPIVPIPTKTGTVKIPQSTRGSTIKIPTTKGKTVRIPSSSKGGTVRIPSATKGNTIKIPTSTKGQTVRTGPTGTLRTGPKGTLRTAGTIRIDQRQNFSTTPTATSTPSRTTVKNIADPSKIAETTNASAQVTSKSQTKISQQPTKPTTAPKSNTIPPDATIAPSARQIQRQSFQASNKRQTSQATQANQSTIPAPSSVHGKINQKSFSELVQKADKNPAIQELRQTWNITPVSIQKELLATRHLTNSTQSTQGQALQNLMESGLLELSTQQPREKQKIQSNQSGQSAKAQIITILNRAVSGDNQQLFQALSDPQATSQESRAQAKQDLLKTKPKSSKSTKPNIPTGIGSPSPISIAPEVKSAKNQLGPTIGTPIGSAMQLDATRQQLRTSKQEDYTGGDNQMQDTYEQGLSDQGYQGPAILGSGITMPEHGNMQQQTAPGSISAEETSDASDKQGGFLETSEVERLRELNKQKSGARLKEMSYPGTEYQPLGGRPSPRQSKTQSQSQQKTQSQKQSLTSKEGFESFAAGLMMMKQQQIAGKKLKAVQAAQQIRANIESVKKIQKNLQWVWRVVNGAELLAGESGVTLVMWFFTANAQLINRVSFKVPFIPEATLVEDAATIFIDLVLMLFMMIIVAFLIIVIAIIAIPMAVQVNLLGNTFDFLGISTALGF